MVTTPRLLKPRTWPPAIPTKACSTATPAISSASSTADLMESTVASRLITTPFRRPLEGQVPNPTMSSPPCSLGSATVTLTLVVPMSRPTMCLLLRPMLGAPIRCWQNGDPILPSQVHVLHFAVVGRDEIPHGEVVVQVQLEEIGTHPQRRPAVVEPHLQAVVPRQADFRHLIRQRRPGPVQEVHEGRANLDFPLEGLAAEAIQAGQDREVVVGIARPEAIQKHSLAIGQIERA